MAGPSGLQWFHRIIQETRQHQHQHHDDINTSTSFTWEHVAQLQQEHSPATASPPTSPVTHALLTAALPVAVSAGTAVVSRPHRRDKKDDKAKKEDREEEKGYLKRARSPA